MERPSELDPIEHWRALADRHGNDRCAPLASKMRDRRLTFGGRLLCPFFRPFFLDPADERRVRRAAETLWRLGERVAGAAAEDPGLMRDLCLSEEEVRLAAIDPGYGVARTAA